MHSKAVRDEEETERHSHASSFRTIEEDEVEEAEVSGQQSEEISLISLQANAV